MEELIMKKKTMAIILSLSLVLSGTGLGVMPQKAAAESSQPATGAAMETENTETPDATAQAPGSETEAPEQTSETPSETEQPGITEVPSETPAQSPAQTPVNTPAATVTPAAVTTTTPAAVTTSAALKVGERFTTGNFVYAVTAVAEGNVKAAVKVRGLSNDGKTKTSVTIPASVTWQGVSYIVSGINEKAFKNNTKLTTVKVGKNVTYIGKRAFQGMTSLKSVTIGSGVTKIKKFAFAGCKVLRKVTIPAKVTFIAEKAFQNCKKLQAVIINSKKINTINSNAFRYVKSGCYVVVPSGKKNTYRSLLLGAKASKLKIYVY